MLPLRTRAYLEYVRFLRRYHRFTIDGADRLLAPGPKLVVAYHGQGLPMDLALAALVIYERHGYLAKSITHSALYQLPLARHVFPFFGGVPGDVPELAAAIDRGETVFVAPGGTREGTRSFRERYKVDWGERRGYLALAAKYRLPILPVASAGVDGRFIGLNNGHAWGKRLGLPGKVPAWVGVGVGVFPLALPLPSKIHMVIGEPFAIDPRGDLDEVHRTTAATVQRLLDQARASA